MLEHLKFWSDWLSANIDPAVPRALFVIAILVSILLIRKAFPRAWEGFARAVPLPAIDPQPLLLVLSKAWQALPATVLGAMTLALGSGGDIRSAVKGAAFGALAALSHEVMKAVPWIPYTGAVGKLKPPTLPVLYILGLTALSMPWLSGCAATSQSAVADVVRRSSAMAFNGATLALLYLDDQEAKHLDAMEHPTELQLQESVLRVERLTRARDALMLVRRVLAGERGDERAKLREAVEALDLVASELEADGVRLPKDLQSALAAARVVL